MLDIETKLARRRRQCGLTEGDVTNVLRKAERPSEVKGLVQRYKLGI